MGDTIVELVWELENGSEDIQEVFASVGNAGQEESFAAAQSGFKAQYRLIVWAFEYDGQPFVRLNGKRYAVYRTYQPDEDSVELYLTDKVGV